MKRRVITGSFAILTTAMMLGAVITAHPKETTQAAEIVEAESKNIAVVKKDAEPAIKELVVTEPVGKDTYICKEYQQYIYEVSEEYGVCPELIMAIVEAESSGRANAVNENCKGLMQVSEKWHKDRMERLGVTDLYNPYGNILVGTDYFMELAAEYEDIGVVLMKYNGDSRADAYAAGKCELSDYAKNILARSAELERLHGK